VPAATTRRRLSLSEPTLASGSRGDLGDGLCTILTRMGGICAALGIGAVAGLLPAVRAARLSPTEALRTV
jgi:hypothetical protein